MKPSQCCCLCDHSSQWVSCHFFCCLFQILYGTDELSAREIFKAKCTIVKGSYWYQLAKMQQGVAFNHFHVGDRFCPLHFYLLNSTCARLLIPWAELLFKCMMPLLHSSHVCCLFPCDAWLPDSSSSKCSNKAVCLLSQPIHPLHAVASWILFWPDSVCSQ